MLNRIKSYWCAVFFRIKTIELAKEKGMTFVTNIYGDAINHYNCRSIWKNKYNHIYRCAQPLLYETL